MSLWFSLSRYLFSVPQEAVEGQKFSYRTYHIIHPSPWKFQRGIPIKIYRKSMKVKEVK